MAGECDRGDEQDQDAAPPADYRLLLPDGWFRVALEPGEGERSVDALVERQFRGVDNAPHLKEELRQDLRHRADKAYRGGGIELFLSLQEVGPFTIPASLLVTLASLRHAEPLPLDVLAQTLAGQDDTAVTIETLRSGPAIRVSQLVRGRGDEDLSAHRLGRSLLVEYHLPVPGTAAADSHTRDPLGAFGWYVSGRDSVAAILELDAIHPDDTVPDITLAWLTEHMTIRDLGEPDVGEVRLPIGDAVRIGQNFIGEKKRLFGTRPVIHSLFYGVRPQATRCAITLLMSWTEPILDEPAERMADGIARTLSL